MNNKKEKEHNCGIYRIVCIAEGHDDSDCYVGQAVDLKTRKNNHFNQLKNSKHKNKHLQRAYNKYGKENFIFEILELCEKDKQILTYWERYYKLYYSAKYNIREVEDSNLGLKMSDETKKKISERNKGKPSVMLGKNHSEETRKKIRNSHNGKTASEEAKNKMREARTGKKESKETREKISNSHLGMGKSGYYGVYQDNRTKKWIGEMRYNHKKIYLGSFSTPEEAALAYNQKSIELFGDTRPLNIIDYNNGIDDGKEK
jgi:group I intron endonuclease